jgi:hypothetical protein
VPLPDRNTIKADLVSLLRRRGTVAPSEAYVALASAWGLTSAERETTRTGRRLYEHEIRWARQELVIEGVVEATDATGKGAWRLKGSAADATSLPSSPSLARLIRGFLESSNWLLSEWLPRYEETVGGVKRAIAVGDIDAAVERVWQQQDNAVSNAGQGVLAESEIKSHRAFFGSLTLEIARDPSPSTFEILLARARQARDERGLSKVPQLLIARAFATIAPDRYHTTVDMRKHERVIGWFEQHTTFRGSPGNWAHRAAELSQFLGRIGGLRESVLTRNMFPWFVYTQLEGTDGRPMFTPGHRSRSWTGIGHKRTETELTVLRHNLLVARLYSELSTEHGSRAVGTEQPSGLGGFVDAVVKFDDKRCWIYEVKVTSTASDAIRQALGQLMEYAYRDGAWNPEKMFVVCEALLDAGSERFLSRLRVEFQVPLEYRRIVV